MIEAPIPDNENERLAALQSLHLLDTPPEERFNRIPRLLTYMFDVPMAYISLIDTDRQWFKASMGMCGTRQTSRSTSFCGHAILSDEALVIPDATKDPRFFDNPMVTSDPFIRFYAGMPLAGPGGQKIGTLCISDRRPRSFHEADLKALKQVAQLVERELNLVEVVKLQEDVLAAREQAAEANRQKAEYLGQLLDHQKVLINELTQAASYVHSLLPKPLKAPPIQTRWRFTPSSKLGGDCFGYNWIDDNHFAVYLLDVSGHGVGAALLSVSVMNALRAQALPHTDFRDPANVLASLNVAFPMEEQNGKYFTIWYGLFDQAKRQLTYASAGHPPALLVSSDLGNGTPFQELGMNSFAIGMIPSVAFASAATGVAPSSRLYVFSDGAYEVEKADGSLMRRHELVNFLTSPLCPCGPDEVWHFVHRENGAKSLKDDFSLLEITFP
jgi:sigma-B regulation protein RsbU (phosphoserine phosphatase)